MPWCPNCRTEYREGFTICNDCKAELVDELGPDSLDLKEVINEIDSEEYLMTVENEVEASVIEGLLRSNKIPVLMKHREAGDYLKVIMGGSNYGIDLYVPSSLIRIAKRIIDESASIEEQDLESLSDEVGRRIEVEEINYESDSEDKSIIKTWMIVLFLLIPILIWVFISFNK